MRSEQLLLHSNCNARSLFTREVKSSCSVKGDSRTLVQIQLEVNSSLLAITLVEVLNLVGLIGKLNAISFLYRNTGRVALIDVGLTSRLALFDIYCLRGRAASTIAR
jgi:hypothetical protein